jgi:hypothetical protein
MPFSARNRPCNWQRKNLKPGDHLFNDTLSGSRLIFLNGPPVFIDSRLFVFAPAFYKEWLAAMNMETSWSSFVEKWSINSVVLAHGYPLYDELMHSPEWRLCLDDGGTSLWLRDVGDVDQRLLKWGIDPDKAESLGLAGEALANDKVCLAAKHFQTAAIYLQQGKLEKARRQAEASLRLVKSARAEALLTRIDQCLTR